MSDNINFIGYFFSIDGPALVFLVIILAIAAYTDIVSQKIPNVLTIPAMVLGVGYHGLTYGLPGLAFSLAGLATGFGLLILFYFMGGMGAGDVKLMAAVGAVLGAKGVFFSFLITALYGGVYSLVIILAYRRIFHGFFKDLYNTFLTFLLIKRYNPVRVVENSNKPRLCYGIAIALGTLTYMAWRLSGYTFSL
jgi:prepilin peptidase CpaA